MRFFALNMGLRFKVLFRKKYFPAPQMKLRQSKP